MRDARIHITGIVQGVGMRPFVYREAVERGVAGWVLNAGDGVHIEAHVADDRALDAFVAALRDDAPAAARIEDVLVEQLAPRGDAGKHAGGTPADATTKPFDGDRQARPLFRIIASDESTERTTLVSPDIATCADCLRELFDPADRRYHYPFINCTNCGPRFTIIRSLPYDRPATSMDAFPMCDACAAEYADPLDRRFHAQPDACFECGPHITWREKSGENQAPAAGRTLEESDAIIGRCAELIAQGGVVAIKGLGGFHLACDAGNDDAVRELRRRKRRSNKPLAVMVGGIDDAEELCHVGRAERELLEGTVRPIVLLRRRALDAPRVERTAAPSPGGPLEECADADRACAAGRVRAANGACSDRRAHVAPAVAFDLPELGVMLPYTPLQHLLLAACASRGVRTLVMTSGNVSEEPIETDDALAWKHLVEGGLADALLGNDRAILSRYDDSVARVMDKLVAPVRRARGFAPRPLELPGVPLGTADGGLPSILACGPEQKATLALTRERPDGTASCFVSQHIGDIENAATFDAWQGALHRFEDLFDLQPSAFACDLHPTYLASQWARSEAASRDLPIIEVQHHHAHVASVMAESVATGALAPEERVLGIAFDGTGAGTDGTIWGGELLLADLQGFSRLAHLTPWPLPGGAASVRDARRNAFSLLMRCGLLEHPGASLLLGTMTDQERSITLTMIERGINSPQNSSMGRLLDAVAALLGVCGIATYEGEPAIELEAAAWRGASCEPGEGYRFDLHVVPTKTPDEPTRRRRALVNEAATPRCIEIDPAPMLDAALTDLARGEAREVIARRVHHAVARLTSSLARDIAAREQVSHAALSGGVFMNRMLLQETATLLRAEGLRPLVPQLVPTNDGCISFGQAAVARARLAATSGQEIAR